jgi:hypothetical protein
LCLIVFLNLLLSVYFIFMSSLPCHCLYCLTLQENQVPRHSLLIFVTRLQHIHWCKWNPMLCNSYAPKNKYFVELNW